MFRAHDENNVSVLAEYAPKGATYYCPGCEAKVMLKKGSIKVAHFAHYPDHPCTYTEDKDCKSEWHRRMQSYFPIESTEYYFTDAETGERRRADVFLEESGIVIEFQKSPISIDEFMSRTSFHLRNKRKIAWVFAQDVNNPYPAYHLTRNGWASVRLYPPYNELCYVWYSPRRCLTGWGDELDIKMHNHLQNYAVFLYTGTENGDSIRKIVDEEGGFRDIVLSVRAFFMNQNLDVNDFFKSEEHWLTQLGMDVSACQHRAVKPQRQKAVKPYQHSAAESHDYRYPMQISEVPVTIDKPLLPKEHEENFGKPITCETCGKTADETEFWMYKLDSRTGQCYECLHRQSNREVRPTKPKTEKAVESSREACPLCDGGTLVKRSGPYGEFLGCSNYPECRYTKSL